jgi:hypothetical protein
MHHRWLILLLLTLSISHHTAESHPPNLEDYPVGPDTYPADISPLTGQLVSQPADLERSPIIVKISNAPPLVRPQAGIGAADLVFEHYAEGGLTRFSAIFHSQAPTRVGSIRSARLIDYELLPMYQGLLAFSGASIGVEDRLNTSEYGNRLFKGVLYGRPYYWRDENIPVPHNMFVNLEALWELARETGVDTSPSLRSLAFDPQPPAAGSPAPEIDIRYRGTRVGWAYDETIGLYRRFADGRPLADANTQEQITAANVVVIYADHAFTDIVESEWQGSVSYSIEIKLWFEGEAVVFRDGQASAARWVRPTREDMIGLRAPDGSFLPLKPGNTWFQVMRPPEQQTPEEEWLKFG